MEALEVKFRKLTTIVECGKFINEYCEKETSMAISFLQFDCGITKLTWKNNGGRVEFYYDNTGIGSCEADNGASWVIQCVAQACTEEERKKIVDSINNIRDTEIQGNVIKAQATAIASNNININSQTVAQMSNSLESVITSINENHNTVNVENVFTQFIEKTNSLDTDKEKIDTIIQAINEMKDNANTKNFATKYQNFIISLGVHINLFTQLLPLLAEFFKS